MDPDYIDLDALYEERTELSDDFDHDDTYDALALDPADEENYDPSDADPATGTEYGGLT